jgi:hypothetical protein
MPRPDEGLIHAWLDGQLPPEEAARIEALAATDPEWAAAVAEARGLVAASSRILSALDHVPAGVVPRGTSARTGHRLPWWTKIAAAVVVVAGGSVVVMQSVPDGRLPAVSTEQGSVPPAPDTQKVADAAPVITPPVPATATPDTRTQVPAATGAGVPAGTVIGKDQAPAPRREAFAAQPVAPPTTPAPTAKANVAVEQRTVQDAERMVAEMSAQKPRVAKVAPSAPPSVAPGAARGVTQGVAPSTAPGTAQNVAPSAVQSAAPRAELQARQTSAQDLAQAQVAVPAQQGGVGGVVALRSAQRQQSTLCYRLVPDSASGPASIMRAVRMTDDTLYVASLEASPLKRAWFVPRDGMKGVMTTTGDLRSTVRVVATPTACPAP